MLPHLYLYANNIALIAAPSEDVKFYLEEIKSALAFSGLEINEDQTKMFSFSKNPSELDSFDTGGTLGHKMGSRKKRSFKYLGYWFSVYIGKVTLEEELMIMRVEEPSKNPKIFLPRFLLSYITSKHSLILDIPITWL